MDETADGTAPPLRTLRFVAALSLAFWAGWVTIYIRRWDGNPYNLFGDYFMLWSAGRLLLEQGVGALYSVADYMAFQHQFRGADQGWYPPPPYPPVFLAVVSALARLPYLTGVLLWLGGSLALHAVALPRTCWRLALTVLVLAPATAINVNAGHNGLLSAGFAMAGFTLLSRYPLAAGVAFGLLSYKPQMFLLVPVALLAAGQWRALASALGTAAAMALVGIALYGWGVTWHVFAYLGEYSRMIEADVPNLGRLMPTVMPALLTWGMPHAAALAGQGLAVVVAVAALWRACRGGIGPASVAVWCAATFLVTPYAMIYDLCLLTVGVIFLVCERWPKGWGEWSGLALVWALPVYGPLLVDAGLPLMPLALVTFLITSMRRLPAQNVPRMSVLRHNAP